LANSDIGLEWHSILGNAASHSVITQLIAIIAAVSIPVTVETNAPPTIARESKAITVIGEVLVPALNPGDIVIMDNLSPHKSDPTLALITEVGAQVLFLPAYSPDLNPIEKMWSKVKSLLRGAEARTPADLIKAIGQALAKVTAKDALGWFTSCGYRFC